MYDVIVIGAGPAGLSAAINIRQRGGTVLCVGTAPDNNPLWKAEQVDNYPGMPGMTGRRMLETFRAHAQQMGAEFMQERVLSTFYTGDHWMISAGSDVPEAYALVFAGGIVRGKAYPGENEYIGKGVSYCATCDGMLYRGRETAVIGFGPSGREEAEFLKGIGCLVTYYESPRKVEIFGEERVTSVRVDDETKEVSCVFVLRPSLSAATLFPELETDGAYIRVNRETMQTNLEGLFAAGDCTGRPLQVAKAVGEGLVAGQNAMELVTKKKKQTGKEQLL